MTKYHAINCRQHYPTCPIGHSSLREHRRAAELQLLVLGGVITNLREQWAFELAPSVVLNGRKKPPLRYVCDFLYERDGVTVVEDAKGVATKDFRIKQHLMKDRYGLEVVLV